MTKKTSLLSIKIEFSDDDLNQLFEPFDPLMQEGFDKLEELSNPAQEPFDPIDYDYLNSVINSFLDPIIDHYFRAEIYGLENLQKDGPAILGCNHSGTAFPYDGLVLDALLWRHYHYMPKYKCRAVFSPKLAKVWWMRPFGIDNFWRRCGAIDMTFKNFNALLAGGERVLYYPEGVPGIGKGFTRRYQLQHFYSSFVVLAAMHDAPFYPTLCVNGEWVNPTSITIKWVDKLFDKLAGVPFFPIPAMIVGIIFPFFYYLAFPSNMKFFVGKPVNIRDELKKNGVTDFTKADKIDYQKVADQIRDSMQELLNNAVLDHGQKPYHVKSLWKKLRELGWDWWKATPLGWPFVFLGHSRDLERPKAGKFWSVIREWDIWFFFFPLGWVLIAATRALRKPPYGYRGLNRKKWRKKTGSYFWNLEKNPIPSRKERFD